MPLDTTGTNWKNTFLLKCILSWGNICKDYIQMWMFFHRILWAFFSSLLHPFLRYAVPLTLLGLLLIHDSVRENEIRPCVQDQKLYLCSHRRWWVILFFPQDGIWSIVVWQSHISRYEKYVESSVMCVTDTLLHWLMSSSKLVAHHLHN